MLRNLKKISRRRILQLKRDDEKGMKKKVFRGWRKMAGER